ncbi:hypothetical protein LIER_40711 [Lithospermum erythrorhizon]|uniref:Uncharacterized protein n=1 Tax=Lithospermum erythrorhizon TaxID=34254 RepID=A0AAV3QZN0_LITER
MFISRSVFSICFRTLLIPLYLLFFALQDVVLQCYKGLVTLYEEASGSSTRIPQLEWELKDLRKRKAQEEGALRRHLKALTRDFDSLKERDAASICNTDSLLVELEVMKRLEDGSVQAVSNLVGAKTAEDLRELLRGSDAGEELLIRSFNQAIARTIHVIQSKLDEASLEVPALFWGSARDDVFPPDRSDS